MFSKAIIAVLAATTVSAAPAPAVDVSSRQTGYQPWEITKLYTHSPSGRPGNDPHSTLNVTINDPNTLDITQTPTGTAIFPPSTANCSAQWLTAADVPWNVELPCTKIDYGAWTFKMVPGTSGTTDFGLEFTLFHNVSVLNKVYSRTFIASDQFKVGNNLSGQCGGSGVCNWALTTTPYAITATEQS